MPTLRAFVGVPVGPSLVRQMSAVRAEFGDRTVRWIPAPNLHLTLKFLGDVEEARVASMREALRKALSDTAGFRVTARGLGVFPDARRPRVLWVGMAAPELPRVARRVERALETFGIERAPAPFRPHATIGRWRRPDPGRGGLQDELARWRDREFGEFRIDAVTLFRSTLQPSGAVYSALEVFRLKPGGDRPAGTDTNETEVPRIH